MTDKPLTPEEVDRMRARDREWSAMTPTDFLPTWSRERLADAYFLACLDRKWLLLTLDAARDPGEPTDAEKRAWRAGAEFAMPVAAPSDGRDPDAMTDKPHDWRDHSSSPHHHVEGDPEPVWGAVRVAAPSDGLRRKVLHALNSEDEVAHGEAYTPERGGLGECAYDNEPWPCRTQRGIDRLRAALTPTDD
jgi:hypothetical protein